VKRDTGHWSSHGLSPLRGLSAGSAYFLRDLRLELKAGGPGAEEGRGIGRLSWDLAGKWAST